MIPMVCVTSMTYLTYIVRILLGVSLALSIPLLYAMAKDVKGWTDEN